MKLRDDQIIAKNAIIEELKENDRATIVRACGTGKTIISIEAILALAKPTDKIVIFAPTLLLIKQLIISWLKVGRVKYSDMYAICWQQQTGKITEEDIPATELSIKVSSDQDEILEDIHKYRVFFCTYMSAPLLKGVTFDFGIFDEAHKTTGVVDKLYSFALDDDNICIKKRLFLTATPRISKKDYIDYSMDDESIYGKICHSLSFRNAIKLGIISDYKILVTIVNDNDLASFKSTKFHHDDDIYNLANIVAIKKAIDTFKVKKIITFHSTVKEANRFTEMISNSNIINYPAYHVSGFQPMNIRQNYMNQFIKSPAGIITNAHCLTEGIDISSIDTVVFINKKTSLIDIVQAAGRAIRKSKDKKCGYIIIPVYLSSGQSLNEIQNYSEFSRIIEILSCLLEVDEVLKEEVSIYAEDPDKAEENYIINYIASNKEIENALLKKVDLVMSEIVKRSIDFRLLQISEYIKENGHGFIPVSYHDQDLAKWATNVRVGYRYETLPKSIYEKLVDAGFVFNFNQFKWEEKLNRYKEWKRKGYHDNDIPDPEIKKWIHKAKSTSKDRKSYQERIELLKSLGANIETKGSQWYDSLNRVKTIIEKLGDICLIRKKEYPAQYDWLRRQRARLRDGELNDKHARELNAIGFERLIKQVELNNKKREETILVRKQLVKGKKLKRGEVDWESIDWTKTNNEIALELGIPYNSVCSARGRMKKKGLIVDNKSP